MTTLRITRVDFLAGVDALGGRLSLDCTERRHGIPKADAIEVTPFGPMVTQGSETYLVPWANVKGCRVAKEAGERSTIEAAAQVRAAAAGVPPPEIEAPAAPVPDGMVMDSRTGVFSRVAPATPPAPEPKRRGRPPKITRRATPPPADAEAEG